MMHSASQPARDRTAIALSIVAHVCLFVLLALTVRPSFLGAPETVENPQVFTISAGARRAVPAPRLVVIAIAPPIIHRTDVSVRLAAPMRRTVAVNPLPAYAPQRNDVERAAPVKAVAQAAPVDHFISHPTPVPDATAPGTAAPAAVGTSAPTAPPAASGNAPTGEDGLFGSNYRPLPSPPTALAAIIARITGHFHIRVKVDENGHATDVRFLIPITDPALASDVRDHLLAMNYVPALCSGLKCAGDLDIVAP